MFGKTDVFLCLGRRGSGKSHLAGVIAAMYPRRVVIDTMAEVSEPGAHVVETFDGFCKKVLELQSQPRFALVFRFNVESDAQEHEFNHALRILYYLGNVHVRIEEVQEFSSPHFLPKWLKNALMKGRHKGMSLSFTTQRPGLLNKSILSQCTHVFAGQLHEKNDLAYVASFLGKDANSLIHIEPRYFFWFRPGFPTQKVHNSLKKV